MKLCYKLKMHRGIDRMFCIQLWLVFLNQQRFKNLQPSPIVVTANDLRVVKVNLMIWVGLQVSAY